LKNWNPEGVNGKKFFLVLGWKKKFVFSPPPPLLLLLALPYHLKVSGHKECCDNSAANS